MASPGIAIFGSREALGARNLDTLRRRTRFEERADSFRQEVDASPPPVEANFPGELVDDQLRLMFLCCHEALPRASRVALTLKIASGFGTAEIAAAFRSSETTIENARSRASWKTRISSGRV